MITLSGETIALIIGFLTLMATAIGVPLAGYRSLRKGIQTGQNSIRTELRESNAEIKSELRSLNQRVDGTNARIDNLAEALYLASPEKTGA